MKANEAPEKIYVKITHPISDKYTEIIAFEDGNGIEYTRTDAFIEKAVEYIITHIPDMHILGVSAKMDERIIEDFKNYMKGE